MDTLTINEGILVLLAERDNVDGSNVVTLMRNAQRRVRAYTTQRLDVLQDAEFVDMVLIGASRNGHIDLFADADVPVGIDAI